MQVKLHEHIRTFVCICVFVQPFSKKNKKEEESDYGLSVRVSGPAWRSRLGKHG